MGSSSIAIKISKGHKLVAYEWPLLQKLTMEYGYRKSSTGKMLWSHVKFLTGSKQSPRHKEGKIKLINHIEEKLKEGLVITEILSCQSLKRKGDRRNGRAAKPKKNTNYSELSKKFLASREWRELRYKALILHGKKCQCCGASPPDVILNVDHIKPRYKFPELALVLSNLQVLCASCNHGKGAWDETDHRE